MEYKDKCMSKAGVYNFMNIFRLLLLAKRLRQLYPVQKKDVSDFNVWHHYYKQQIVGALFDARFSIFSIIFSLVCGKKIPKNRSNEII